MNWKETLKPYHLLNHAFYRAWETGSVSKASLQEYATQYYHQVLAFPRYVSATHSQCVTLEERSSLRDNLNDEEGGPISHPDLWLNFCAGLGLDPTDVKNSQPKEAINDVMKCFFEAVYQSKASALGALLAYESQIPEIAKFKFDHLKNYYISEEKYLDFFSVHEKADVYHTQALETLWNDLSVTEKNESLISMEKLAQKLWFFLDSMEAPLC